MTKKPNIRWGFNWAQVGSGGAMFLGGRRLGQGSCHSVVPAAQVPALGRDFLERMQSAIGGPNSNRRRSRPNANL